MFSKCSQPCFVMQRNTVIRGQTSKLPECWHFCTQCALSRVPHSSTTKLLFVFLLQCCSEPKHVLFWFFWALFSHGLVQEHLSCSSANWLKRFIFISASTCGHERNVVLRSPDWVGGAVKLPIHMDYFWCHLLGPKWQKGNLKWDGGVDQHSFPSHDLKI